MRLYKTLARQMARTPPSASGTKRKLAHAGFKYHRPPSQVRVMRICPPNTLTAKSSCTSRYSWLGRRTLWLAACAQGAKSSESARRNRQARRWRRTCGVIRGSSGSGRFHCACAASRCTSLSCSPVMRATASGVKPSMRKSWRATLRKAARPSARPLLLPASDPQFRQAWGAPFSSQSSAAPQRQSAPARCWHKTG